SPLLLEKKELFCPNCAKAVPVRDIYISAGPYSIYRDVLMQNLLRYRHLLMEAEKEIEKLSAKAKTSVPDDISRGSMKKFIDQLKELLDGCRDHLRAPAGNAVVECAFGGVRDKGTLVNISTSGVCIDLGKSANLPKKGVNAALRFMDDKGGDYLALAGPVAWSDAVGHVGIRFPAIDEKSRKLLEEYIERHMHVLNMPKKTAL
ncbi:MAG: PilZ domain-containing protein, partial [Thermodesulfobacteriota bacterium]